MLTHAKVDPASAMINVTIHSLGRTVSATGEMNSWQGGTEWLPLRARCGARYLISSSGFDGHHEVVSMLNFHSSGDGPLNLPG